MQLTKLEPEMKLIALAMKKTGTKKLRRFIRDAYRWFRKDISDEKLKEVYANIRYHTILTDEVTDYCLDVLYPPKEKEDAKVAGAADMGETVSAGRTAGLAGPKGEGEAQ